MKIIFFGTSDFSLSILKGLIDLKQDIVAVVSQPDKINGRNKKIILSPIKNYCVQNGIPLFQFANLNKEGEETLKNFEPDLFVTASYGQLIKQNILDIPKFGTLNVHPSLLPKYRGATPIQTAVMNGDEITGVTLMKTDIGMDSGDIYLQKEIALPQDISISGVFDMLSTLSIDCLKEFFSKFDYYISHPIPQDDSKATYCHLIKNEDYLLDFNSNAIKIVNKIRALENCYFVYNGTRYIVQKAKVMDLNGAVGEILSGSPKTGLVIGCKDSSIEIENIKPEGKNFMPAKAYMNAGKFKLGDIIN